MAHTVALYYGDIPLWDTKYHNIETVAGIVAASIPILAEINCENADENKYHIRTNSDISDFRVKRGIHLDDLETETCNSIDEGFYGIWVKAETSSYYNLYKFRTGYFMQGIISFAHSCTYDFRDCFYGCIVDAYGEQYGLNDYFLVSQQFAYGIIELDDVTEFNPEGIESLSYDDIDNEGQYNLERDV